jgi:hypothetical protein
MKGARIKNMIKKYVAFKDICELESQISWDILSYGPV